MKLKIMLRNMDAINKVNIKYGGKKKKTSMSLEKKETSEDFQMDIKQN